MDLSVQPSLPRVTQDRINPGWDVLLGLIIVVLAVLVIATVNLVVFGITAFFSSLAGGDAWTVWTAAWWGPILATVLGIGVDVIGFSLLAGRGHAFIM